MSDAQPSPEILVTHWDDIAPRERESQVLDEEPGQVIAMTKAPESASAALDVLLMDATDSTGSRFVPPGAAT